MSHLIDICICPFRRPQVVETLESLRQLVIPEGVDARIIVIDNDETPSAQERVQTIQLPFEIIYHHAPFGNISIARNAALAAANGDYLAFIDDDETVSADWLEQLYQEAVQSEADVVFGPAVAVYPEGTEEWMVAGDYHSTKAPSNFQDIRTGCSANVLLRRGFHGLQGLQFDLNLGRSGGEDTVFFYQLWSCGAVLRFARDARVYENVAVKRLSLSWLLARKVRAGQSYARAVLLTASGATKTRMSLLTKAIIKVAYCLFRATLSASDASKRNSWLVRGAFHRGVVGKCFGRQEREFYGSNAG